MPPLRDRREDVAELAHYFLFRFDRELNMDLRGFAPETLERLQAYEWPGNVRELQGVVKQAMLNASGHLILPEFLSEAMLEPPARPHPVAASTGDLNLASFIDSLLPHAQGRLHDDVIAAVERLLFTRVLQYTHGHQSQASELLGINRATLRHKLRLLGLNVDRPGIRDAAGDDKAAD